MLDGDLAVEVGPGPEPAVRFRFTVTNGDDEAVGLVFPDAGRADVEVRADGQTVWRWSDGRMVAQVVTEARLEPGESATVEMEWPDPEPGTYEARAELTARRHECAAEATFAVPEQ